MAKETQDLRENRLEEAYDQAVIRWMAPEFIRYKRGWVWYTMTTLVIGALIYYAYATGSVTMILVCASIYIVLLLQHTRHPKLVEAVISTYGIKFGKKKLPFSQMKEFWILHEPPYLDELHLKTGERMHPELVISLRGTDASMVRDLLSKQLPELEGKHEDFLDILIRLFRLA